VLAGRGKQEAEFQIEEVIQYLTLSPQLAEVVELLTILLQPLVVLELAALMQTIRLLL
jgi:hypothetical protein